MLLMSACALVVWGVHPCPPAPPDAGVPRLRWMRAVHLVTPRPVCPGRPGARGAAPVAPRRLAVRAGDVQTTYNDPGALFGKLRSREYLDAAAKRFALGVSKGIDEDEMVALEFRDSGDELLEKYGDALKSKLKQRAAELQEEEEERLQKLAASYLLGKEAYECGEYAAALKLLEKGVEEAGEDTSAGGDCQLWLALTYMALGRVQDAVDLCTYLENNHPQRKIKRQAEDLRYIFEAPKLEVSPEERVTIPLMQSDTWRKYSRRSGPRARANKKSKVKETYWDKAKWEILPPALVELKWYYQVLWGSLMLGILVYANMHATSLTR